MSSFNVLITGANRGIGLGLVKQFLAAKEATHVFAACRAPGAAEELNEISDNRLKAIQLEVTDDASIGTAFKAVELIVGAQGLNLLINNAGISPDIAFEKLDRSLVAQVLDINAISPLLITQVFLPLLRRASVRHATLPVGIRRAAIVNVSSMLGSITENTTGSVFPGNGHHVLPYRASKAALNAISKSLSIDLNRDRILSVSQCPGWVQTDMGEDNASLTLDEATSGFIKNILRYGEAENGGFFKHTGDRYQF